MFDFISYARDTGFQIRISAAGDGALVHLEVRDPDTGFCEKHDITDREAAGCGNIDVYTGQVLDQMAARIGSKKATLYANRHKGNQRRDIEKLFRDMFGGE